MLFPILVYHMAKVSGNHAAHCPFLSVFIKVLVEIQVNNLVRTIGFLNTSYFLKSFLK